jgi:hypothetical protein
MKKSTKITSSQHALTSAMPNKPAKLEKHVII